MVQKNARLLIFGAGVLVLGCAILMYTFGRSDPPPTLTPEQTANMPGERDPVPVKDIDKSGPTLMPNQ